MLTDNMEMNRKTTHKRVMSLEVLPKMEELVVMGDEKIVKKDKKVKF